MNHYRGFESTTHTHTQNEEGNSPKIPVFSSFYQLLTRMCAREVVLTEDDDDDGRRNLKRRLKMIEGLQSGDVKRHFEN